MTRVLLKSDWGAGRTGPGGTLIRLQRRMGFAQVNHVTHKGKLTENFRAGDRIRQG